MVKLHRGDVIDVKYHYDSKTGEIKSRPVIVLQNAPKNSDVITVYCTSQNDGNDNDCIFVKADSDEGKRMGLTKDTYIRPGTVRTIKKEFIKRLLGKCSLMHQIQTIIDKNMSA